MSGLWLEWASAQKSHKWGRGEPQKRRVPLDGSHRESLSWVRCPGPYPQYLISAWLAGVSDPAFSISSHLTGFQKIICPFLSSNFCICKIGKGRNYLPHKVVRFTWDNPLWMLGCKYSGSKLMISPNFRMLLQHRYCDLQQTDEETESELVWINDQRSQSYTVAE